MEIKRCGGCGDQSMFETKGPEGETIWACLTCRRYMIPPNPTLMQLPSEARFAVKWDDR